MSPMPENDMTVSLTPRDYYSAEFTPVEGVVANNNPSTMVLQEGSNPAAPNTWSTSFFSCRDWKRIIASAICLPCATAEAEAVTEEWSPNRQESSSWGRVLPILALDLIPCMTVGLFIPLGSTFTNIRNRRVYREHYNIKGNLVTDILSSICLPCSIVQLVNESDVQCDSAAGQSAKRRILSQPVLMA